MARTWSTRFRTWSRGRSLRKSRASGPCAVPWHLSASSSEGSKISAVTRAVSVRRDWRLQDNARAEDRLATKRCDVDTKPLPARHISVNDYSPAIRVLSQARCRICCRGIAIKATVAFRLTTIMQPVSVRVMAVSPQCTHNEGGDQVYEKRLPRLQV